MPEGAAAARLSDQGGALGPDLPFGRGSNVISLEGNLYQARGSGPLSSSELLSEIQAIARQPTSHKAMAEMTREEFESKLEAAAAKTDTKFAEMLGEIRLISSDIKGEIGKVSTRLDSVERSTGGVKATIILTAIAGLAIVVGILGYGQQWFGIGLSTRDTVRATIREMQEPPSLPAPPKPHQ